MRRFARCTVAAVPLILLTGCVGMIADSISKSMLTGDTYAAMSATLEPPSEGAGRVFVYRTESSTKHSLMVGAGLMKNPTLFTVNGGNAAPGTFTS